MSIKLSFCAKRFSFSTLSLNTRNIKIFVSSYILISIITKRDGAAFTRRIGSEGRIVIEHDIDSTGVSAAFILCFDNGEGWIVGLGQLLFDKRANGAGDGTIEGRGRKVYGRLIMAGGSCKLMMTAVSNFASPFLSSRVR